MTSSPNTPRPSGSPSPARTMILGTLLIVVMAAGIIALLAVQQSGTLSGAATATQRPTNTPNAGAGETIIILEPAVPVRDFALPASTGETLSLSDLRGKAVLLYFGYTNCPDFCPVTLAQFAAVRAELGRLGEDVQGVMVSVDPERDTPDVLRTYVTQFDPTFIGMQGDIETLDEIAEDYGLSYVLPEHEGEHEGGDELIDHTVSSYLLDADGRLRMIFSFGTPTRDIANAVRQVLTEVEG
jgi:protein SCO1